MQLFSILFFAVVVEGFVEWIKTISDKGRFSWTHIAALVLGVAVAFAADLDLFAATQMPMAWPVAGHIMTGVLLARGSNYMHSLIDMVNNKNTDD